MRKLILGTLILLLLAACSSVPEPTPQPAPVIATSAPTEVESASPAPEEAAADASAEEAETLSAATFPNPEDYIWTLTAQGFEQPLDIQNAGDGSNRLFIVERGGTIRIIENGLVLNESFLDISKKVRTNGSEQGLLGLTFHPNYVDNGRFFINYTDLNGNSVIARYQVSRNANQADAKSETVLMHIKQPYGNHNGGVVAFGLDGFLYIGLGDGGSSGDPQENGQSLNTFLGKILRIDVDGGETYVVPADNPFVDGTHPEIWAYGLRNPWRFSFDSLTGDLYIADVGQNEWEEINFLPAGIAGGANFGWDFLEGTHVYDGTPPADFDPVPPVAEYNHDEGCSVTGGNVYRGAEFPEWQAVYLYGDFCSGAVWGLLQVDGEWQSEALFYTGALLSSFGEGEDGTLYYADYNTESIYRLSRR